MLCAALRSRGVACTQNPKISGYYPDIAITGTNILVEVDGGVHASAGAKARDRQRTKHLNLAGYRVLRFSNNQVDTKLRTVVQKIEAAIGKYQAGRTGLVFRGAVPEKQKARAKAKAEQCRQATAKRQTTAKTTPKK